MKRAASLLLFLALSGCVVVGHDVEPDIAETDQVVLPAEEILLTLGPRQFLETMAEAITDTDPEIDVVDGVRFRDSAFPEGGWTLAEMLTPPARHRVRQELQTDYLLLFGPLAYESGEVEGPNTMSVGMYFPAAGVGHIDEASTLSGLVVDLASGQIVSQVDVTAEGASSFAIWIIVAVGTYAETGESAINGMARALATEIRGHSDKARPKIALMAAEAARLWKPIGSSGWTRIEGDNGEALYHVFGECGWRDARVNLQQAFDRAMGLYQAEAWDASYACFAFVRDAGDEGSALALEAQRRMEFMIGAGLVDEPDTGKPGDADTWEAKP